jgi:hypothetical protein
MLAERRLGEVMREQNETVGFRDGGEARRLSLGVSQTP